MSAPSSTASHFLLLQCFLGLVLFAHIVFFHEDTTRTRHVNVIVNESQTGRGKGESSVDVSCRMCENLLANDVVWSKSSWKLMDIEKCEYPIRNENEASAYKNIRERFRQFTANKQKDNDSILFIGNSVSRRQMYAVAHILGGEKARVNAIARNATLSERYGVQRVFDSKTKYHSAFEVKLNIASGEMGEPYSCLPESVENIAEEILEEKESMRCSNAQMKHDINALRLGFLYVGSGRRAHTALLKALDAWIKGAKTRKDEYALDTYKTIVIQVGLDSGALRMSDGYGEILERLKELISLRHGLRVIFSGVHHHFINANHDDVEYQEELREFLDTSLWPSVRKMKGAEVLDTTKATIEGVSSGVLEHERGSSWHFMDEGRIFLASLLMNHLLRSCS